MTAKTAKNKKRGSKSALDKFQVVTDRLIDLIEQGQKPWQKPWVSVGYQNLISKHVYSGINPIICQIDMMAFGYELPYFVTVNQCKQHDWSWRGGKATWIKKASTYLKEVEDENGEKKEQVRFSTQWYQTYNIGCLDDSQAEVKISHYVDKILRPLPPVGTNQDLEDLVNAQGATIIHGGDQACYSPSTDIIKLPEKKQFRELSGYYATAIHELSHWTGHESRLNREMSGGFGSEKYAFEELIAELSTSFILNEYGIEAEVENHASYLANWLSALKGDKSFFFSAATAARKAAEFILPDAKSQEVELPIQEAIAA